MNAELATYNEASRAAAATHGALLLDVWTPFTATARHLPPLDGDGPISLWSDGAHLTELGDTVLLQQAERLLAEQRIVEKLLDSPLLERDCRMPRPPPHPDRFVPRGSTGRQTMRW
ncbi:hypothetical protein ACFP1Z_11885 [Streptomyces gamaensis]|uniref:SGNH domain-containing protein n=1 Tax=Streptomyces gamaensis TaxID=1763542 RepID=A0ABW0YXE8_9ACTN